MVNTENLKGLYIEFSEHSVFSVAYEKLTEEHINKMFEIDKIQSENNIVCNFLEENDPEALRSLIDSGKLIIGYYKIYLEKWEDGECVNSIRLDLGDGVDVNAYEYAVLREEV